MAPAVTQVNNLTHTKSKWESEKYIKNYKEDILNL